MIESVVEDCQELDDDKECQTVTTNNTKCNKNLGDQNAPWARGSQFVVRGGGHIGMTL